MLRRAFWRAVKVSWAVKYNRDDAQCTIDVFCEQSKGLKGPEIPFRIGKVSILEKYFLSRIATERYRALFLSWQKFFGGIELAKTNRGSYTERVVCTSSASRTFSHS